jgi:hypothetical protein
MGGSVGDGDDTDDEGDEQPAIKKRKVEAEAW